MAFKQDEDFLRFITMGAAGTAHAARWLAARHGHRIDELERYALANKLWATKIKRLRVPDLVCLDCGIRIEARTKSKLEIKVSESANGAPERAWDYGLRDRDLVAFIPWDRRREKPRGHVEAFTVRALRGSIGFSKLGVRKSASEGAERDRSWRACVPGVGGSVLELCAAEQKVVVRLDTGRRQTYAIPHDAPAFPYLGEGERFEAGERFLLGVVPPPSREELACPGPLWDERADLAAEDPVTRYVAVKVAGLRGRGESIDALRLLGYDDPDVRIQLEAWGSLARIEPDTFTDAVVAAATHRDPQEQGAMAIAMEAMFILSEIATPAAGGALARLAADRALDSEARCAAVWGLGIAGLRDQRRLLDFIADDDEDVALHALAGIGPLSADAAARVKATLLDSPPDSVAAAAIALLAQEGELGADILLELAARDDRTATWAVAGLGQIPEETVRAASNGRLTADLERRLQPAWLLNRSWTRRGDVEARLRFLRRQTVRH